VQSLEPAGVGARNLSECIVLQLRQLDPATPARDIAIRVALEHLDLVANQQLALLRRQLRCSDGRWKWRWRWCAPAIRAPARRSAPRQAEYVIPDVFVRRTEHGWIVEVNQATVPRVRVNQSYANLISRVPGPRDAAHAAAGGPLADAQPRDPQRNAGQGGALHRAAPGRASSSAAKRRWSR
jgi:RNA polymerase sigma-54 factor